MRKIVDVWSADQINMGGNAIYQSLPHIKTDQIDPFLLIHHWKEKFTGGANQSEVGVGPHPHRGFAPVTLIFQGGIHHRDSLGNDSIVYGGGTQWMNAGSGVTHSERPTKQLAEEGGWMELIQFWVNTPAAHKMDPPEYIPLQKEETPTFKSEDGKVDVAVVSGELNGVKGPINAKTPMLISTMTFAEHGTLQIKVPKSFNTLVYVLNGNILVQAQTHLTSKKLALFDNNDEHISFKAFGETKMILLAGAPISETVASYGPFVMNNSKELMQAIHDAQSGAMGQLQEIFE